MAYDLSVSILYQTIYSDHGSLFGFNLHNFGYAIVWLECLLPPSELRRKNTVHLFPECLIWQNIIKEFLEHWTYQGSWSETGYLKN